MNPEEKAKDIVDNFSRDGYDIVLDEKQAKRCALLAVDEVIEALDFHQWQNRNEIDWWKEVKIEIEKL
jgi:hypothetical protein